MKNNGTVFRRILSLFMAIVICITMQDMAVFAASDISQTEEGAAAVLSDSEQKASVEEIQKVEKVIVKGRQRRKDFIPLEGYQVTAKELSSAFMSMAYQHIMRDLLGIPCLVVINSDRSHVWNMVKIDGNYYHVDVTWARNALQPSAPSGKYFLLTDGEIRALDASSHGAWSGPYDMETADGPSYAERNPLWSMEDNFNQAERGSGIVYYEGCYYFAAYHNIYRVADLLDYEESKRQRVCQTDNNTTQWARPVAGM